MRLTYFQFSYEIINIHDRTRGTHTQPRHCDCDTRHLPTPSKSPQAQAQPSVTSRSHCAHTPPGHPYHEPGGAETKGRCASACSIVRIRWRLRRSYHHFTPHPALPPSSTSGSCSSSTPHHGSPCLVSGGACWPQSAPSQPTSHAHAERWQLPWPGKG